MLYYIQGLTTPLLKNNIFIKNIVSKKYGFEKI